MCLQVLENVTVVMDLAEAVGSYCVGLTLTRGCLMNHPPQTAVVSRQYEVLLQQLAQGPGSTPAKHVV
jgi:hypothetical protein